MDRVTLKHSISLKLLRYVFFSYCLVAILLTSIHMAIEYGRSNHEIHATLQTYQHIFEKTLTNEVWQLDLQQLDATLTGILQLPEVVGVSVLDRDNHYLARRGSISPQEKQRDFLYPKAAAPAQFTFEEDLLWHTFDLVSVSGHGPAEPLGSVYFYFNSQVAIDRVFGIFQSILLFAVLKTLLLWTIFLLFGQRLLGRPLHEVTQRLAHFFEKQTGQPLQEWAARGNEIDIIEQTVTELSTRLSHTLDDLKMGYTKLRVISTIFELSSARGELTNLLQSIIQELVNTTWLSARRNRIQGGCISLFAQGSHRQAIRVFHGMPEEVVSHCEELEQGGCLCGRSVKQGEILFSPHLYQEAIPVETFCGESGYYSVPILSRSNRKVIGVVTCLIEGHSPSMDEEKSFLSNIAYAISNLLEHRMADEAAERHQLHLEKTVRERTTQLLHAERLATLGTFAAGMAHEINNPNSFIRGNVQYLQSFWEMAQPILKRHAAEDPSGRVLRFMDEIPETLKDILDGSQRIETIVDSLKKYSKGGMEADRVICRLSEPMHDALHLLEHVIKKSQVIIENHIPPELTLYCDRQQMCQVFVNLINNALDALESWPTPPKKIRIWGERLDNHLWIHVANNGPSIPEEAIGKLFDPFFTTKGKTKGTGLGLAIVQGIIEDHRGQITIYSAPDSDTEVLIILPAATPTKVEPNGRQVTTGTTA
ncbi:MAG: GHKL domain-containing protein [Magnetococcales bacterium]|nr:GHKL domain-containing protein [Magnetococcales bacterium]